MKNKLREIRKGQQLPMLGLAAKARVSTATLAQIENWDYTPRPEVQERIANVLGVPPQDIWPALQAVAV